MQNEHARLRTCGSGTRRTANASVLKSALVGLLHMFREGVELPQNGWPTIGERRESGLSLILIATVKT